MSARASTRRNGFLKYWSPRTERRRHPRSARKACTLRQSSTSASGSYPCDEAHLRTRIKICGITRTADAVAAAQAGADAIGLVFYPPSPRYLSVERAREVRDAL